MFTILKNPMIPHRLVQEHMIPIDESRLKWPWVLMDVGDCVIVDEPDLIKKAQTYCHVFGNKRGWRFKTKTKEDGLYVWRIA